MRIIAGEWRGRALKAPAGRTTRPTSDRAREALFSMLTSRLGSFEGLRVADLFAGTGALGLEALSRGAAHCTFVENDRGAIAALKANVDALGAGARAEVRAQSALTPVGGPFDLVMLDPPYGTGLGQQALAALAGRQGFNTGCLVSIETARDEAVDIPGLAPDTERTYGKARLVLLRAL
ncbi:16S rRNA (guanine(966)-N(2))-methyltransferase RsmD [Sphingomonas sp. LaA6.9]|uniref:16S rRNA (guanine(966)-N(2))-methyltransferase RsmD n=1 Tax=Sphingomonas sp. LaA6.9 TaxID=2919914 RepID=UPI001F4F8264|nr:16S rRNA (guanine(966)-N(2))-methyltransferase RsmD [Sphingomonas sp. LaA6.9]MCJ8157651.1 16S rRNA (guanine(966)-N(2))-methyltransferase RsmD [Sphingomonas sp. LaA6.9]